MLSIKSPAEMASELSSRLKQKRLEYNWTREELARRSGVAVASIRRFETQSEISLNRFLQLCYTLHALDGFDQLLQASPPITLSQIEKQLSKPPRKRARKKS